VDNFVGSIVNYGLVEGLSLYLKLKNFQIDLISTSKLQHTVYLRPGSTDNCVFKQIFLKQDFNIAILQHLVVERVLDLGANIGMSSLYLANRYADAQIIAIEPDNSNGDMFKKNLEHYPNVNLIQGVIRGTNKKVEMIDTGKGESGYEARECENGLTGTTIMDIMQKYQWDTIDILKMDIEGSEKSVFEHNFEAWLPKTKVLFVELHEHKAPGCSKVLSDALANYNFEWSKSGEYEVLVNMDLI